MDFPFRPALTAAVQDYASHTPHADAQTVDCSLGVNPYGFAPAVTRALQTYDYSRIGSYPHTDVLRPAIIRYWRDFAALRAEQITLCNGSFLGLFCLNNIFSGSARRKVVSFVPTFTDMLTSARFFGMEVVPIPARDAVTLRPDTGALLRAIGSDTALVYLDRPNNPTGSLLPREDVAQILTAARRAGCFVLVDEAFADFLPREEACVPLLETFDNLIIARTFSKGFGLADLRAGYLLAPPRVTELIAKTVNPFILSESVRLACAEALAHPEQPTAHAEAFASAKRALRAAADGALTMADTDDRTQILTLRAPAGADLQALFLEQGILTVSGREFEALDASAVRVSIPAGADAEKLVAAAARIGAALA